jgi:DNA polymerase III delta prime subunit
MASLSTHHPKYASDLLGHENAEDIFLKAYRSHRLHHAWLIGGPKGIGKATFAWRIARFILAFPNPSPNSPLSSLFLSPTHPIFLTCAANAHPDLVVLEPSTQQSTIPLETLRSELTRLQMTTSGTGFRVCLIDSIDHLTLAGMNALLKILEEPPPQTLFLLITHHPYKVLHTVRSRCWRLNLSPFHTKNQENAHKEDKKKKVFIQALKDSLIGHPSSQDMLQAIHTISAKDFSSGTLGTLLESWIIESCRSLIAPHDGSVPSTTLTHLEQRLNLWRKTYHALQQTCAVHGDPRPLLLHFIKTWHAL